MDRRRFLFGGVPTPPPPAYTYLQYIRNTSNAYINTLIVPDTTYGMEIVVSNVSAGDNIYAGISGCLAFGSNSRAVHMRWGSEVTPSASRYNIGTILSTLQLNYNNNRLPRLKKDTDDDWTVYTNPTMTKTWTTSNPIYLFCRNDNNAPAYNATMSVYSFKVTEGSSTVANLVPAKRNLDQVVGMYDTVRQMFFTSPNGTDFLAGPEL